MKKKNNMAKKQNFFLIVTFVIVVTQQIYFPQKLKYFHLALLFLYMVFHDFLKPEFRSIKYDYLVMSGVMLCSMISVVEAILNNSLSYLYLVVLCYVTVVCIAYVYSLVQIVKQPKEHYKIDSKGSNLVKKGMKAMNIIFTVSILVMLFTIGYVVYLVIV